MNPWISERVLDVLAQAKKVAVGTSDDVAIALFEGIICVELRRESDGRSAFEHALLLEPNAQLPFKVSPEDERPLPRGADESPRPSRGPPAAAGISSRSRGASGAGPRQPCASQRARRAGGASSRSGARSARAGLGLALRVRCAGGSARRPARSGCVRVRDGPRVQRQQDDPVVGARPSRPGKRRASNSSQGSA